MARICLLFRGSAVVPLRCSTSVQVWFVILATVWKVLVIMVLRSNVSGGGRVLRSVRQCCWYCLKSIEKETCTVVVECNSVPESRKIRVVLSALAPCSEARVTSMITRTKSKTPPLLGGFPGFLEGEGFLWNGSSASCLMWVPSAEQVGVGESCCCCGDLLHLPNLTLP